MCIEFCTAEADPEDDDQFDMKLGKDVEEGIDDVLVLQDSANRMIAKALAIAYESEGVNADPDPYALPPDRNFDRPNEAFVASAMYANIAAEGWARLAVTWTKSRTVWAPYSNSWPRRRVGETVFQMGEVSQSGGQERNRASVLSIDSIRIGKAQRCQWQFAL